MINWGILTLYTLTVIAYNGTPGPVIMLTTGTSLAHNFRHTVKTILGADLGSITLMLIAILTMLGLISINYNILNVLKLLGSIYLLQMSIRSIYTVVKLFLSKSQNDIKVKFFKGGIKQGYSVGVSNPKDIIFFASFFPQFINVSSSAHYSVFILGLVWVIFDWIILLAYAILANRIISKSFENIFVLIANVFIFGIATFSLQEVAYYFFKAGV